MLPTLFAKKAALAVGAGAMTVGMLGGAVFAAQPSSTTEDGVFGAMAPITADSSSDKDKDHAAALRRILDGLVDKGVITAAQRDAIVDAIQKTHATSKDFHKDVHKDVLADVLKVSADYLGVTTDQLREQLKSGKSLAEIAKATTGKTVDGLVDTLTKAANAHIDKLVADGKITKEQGETLRTKAAAEIVKIVNHEGGPRAQEAQTKTKKK